METSIYKTQEAKKAIMRLYDSKLASLHIEYESLWVDTSAGKTHVLATGEKGLPPLVILHGINAGAPLALEAIKDLRKDFRIFAVDSIGQATRSAETRPPFEGDAYGRWLAEAMDGLGLAKAAVIGVSFGAFLLQKLMAFAPEKLEKALFVVPGGFVNGPFWPSMKKLSFPLMKFLLTKKESDLISFMEAFYDTNDAHSVAFQKEVLLGLKMDYRRPPLFKDETGKKVLAPVYAIVAENDIFFPGDKTLERCRAAFPNFKEAYVLKSGKHIPDASGFPKIAAQIEKWLKEEVSVEL